MKKALGIITLIVTICLIFVLMIWQWDKIKSIENNVNKRIENIENKDENVRNKINKFAESVKFSVCSNADYSNTEVWTTFVYKYKWDKYLWTAWHVVLQNPSRLYLGCAPKDLKMLSYPFDSSVTYNDNSDFISYPYNWDVEAIDIPLCNKTEIIGQSVWIIWYPSYTTESIKKMKEATKIITKWQISWYTTMANGMKQPHLNYFVTNPLDTWSSGSPVIVEKKDWFCLLWIATWWQKGDNVWQGMIQNVYNIVE
jgi:hypothetical protein